jgi:hypothetical protein
MSQPGARERYEAMEARRHALPAKRFPPAPHDPCPAVWRPMMTEQERNEHEQYVRNNNLPF